MAVQTPKAEICTLATQIAVAAALLILNLALTLFVLDRHGHLRTPEIVSINAPALIREFVATQEVGVSDQELQDRIRTLNQSLDGAIDAFAVERNVIVVSSTAALGGTRDVTADVLASLAGRR